MTARTHKLVRENWYRDVWLLVISIFIAYTAFQTMESVDHVNDNRRLTLAVTCGSVNAVIRAGHDTIANAPRYSPKLERNLVRLGLPPYPQRKRQAAEAGDLYGRRIARSVADHAGFQAASLIRADGTIDCGAFARLIRPFD